MNTEDLIKQLTSEARPVTPLRGNRYRFSILMALNLAVVLMGLSYWYLKKNEIHFPAGRSFWELLVIFLGVAFSAWNITTSVSPHSVLIKINKTGSLFIAAWILILLGAFYVFFTNDPTEALIAFNYKTWVCPEVIFSVAIPAAICSFFYLRQGQILYPPTTFFYWSLSASSLGVFALSFICPWDDPLHELLWHVLPVFICLFALTVTARILFSLHQSRQRL